MTKSELKKALASRFGEFEQQDIDDMVDLMLDEIRSGLIRKEGLEIRGFGSFFLQHRVARMARNPRTGESVHTPNRYSLQFRPGKQLRQRVNKQDSRIRSSSLL